MYFSAVLFLYKLTLLVVKTGNDIQFAASLIKQGKLVAFPTETVYGLGADAFNAEAVAQIFNSKERPSFDPLIVHVSNLKQVDLLSKHTDQRFLDLAKAFWPGPLTIVVEKKDSVPDIVTSGLNTVGIRMPGHELARQLIEASGTPVAAPSANKFGRVSPTQAKHVASQLSEVDYIVSGGNSAVGIESTVIRLHADGFELLRPGAITEKDLKKIIPGSKIKGEVVDMHSPGLLKSHYSTLKPIYLKTELPIGLDLKKAGYISFGKTAGTDKYVKVEVLSENKRLNEAAVNLFRCMHLMENSEEVEFIIIEPVPEEGIGVAIMDRMRKAVHQYKN